MVAASAALDFSQRTLDNRGRVPKLAVSVDIEIEIDRPVAEVWAYVSDLTRLPEWLDEFEDVTKESSGPLGKGSTLRYTVRPGPRTATLEVVEWEPGRRLAWDGPPLPMLGGGGRPRGWFEVQRLDEGRTRFLSHYEPELSGPPVLLSPYLRHWLKKQRTSDRRRLKELIEASARLSL
jgi:uncharacterized protein YndB with AHSA1/START domain